MRAFPRCSGERAGFTLAEVAVTLVIVGIALVFVLQGLSQAKMTSYFTTNRKIARQLAMETLSQIESGLYWEDVQEGGDRLVGSYAEEGYEAFEYEVLFGEEDDFSLRPRGLDQRDPGSFDSWSRDPDSDRDGIPDSEESESSSTYDEEGDEEEEAEEPYEIVRIQVLFPKVGLPDAENSIVLERWIPWDQVYGEDEEEAEGAEGEEGAIEE